MRLRAALAEVGVEPQAVEMFALAAQAAGALARGEDLARITGATAAGQGVDGTALEGGRDRAGRAASGVLGLVEALTWLGAHLDSALVRVTSDLSVRNGRILLDRRGVEDPGALTSDQARRWRSRTRSVTRREIEAATGWGTGEVSDLVALANAPAGVAEPVCASMAAGVTPWRLARRFFREMGHQGHADAADVAEHLFGTDPEQVCTDRLDPDGHVKDGPWEHRAFYRALEGEATKLASRDPQAAAGARARAHERRDLRVSIDADGTGTIRLTGTAAQAAAIADRMEKAARAARAAGDERPLSQLRADIALSLLMHSVLDLPGGFPEDFEDLVATRWSEQMKAVLLALPKAVLNVIVPFDAFVHSPTNPTLTTRTSGIINAAPDGAGTIGSAPGRSDPPGRCPSCGHPASRGEAFRPPKEPPETPTAARCVPEEVLSVGMVTGAFPQFLTADAVRELALSPGTTLYRLLTDPADGRCVERSIASYAPDAAMRAQVHAADVTCRAPGCDRHAPYTQLDHVIAYSAGGPTSEVNLQDLHTGHHDPKTQGEWTAVMDANRDITWRSLLGRIYRTRSHDYRQYSTLLRQALDRVEQHTEELLAADARARQAARDQGRPTSSTDARGQTRASAPITREQALADAVDRAVYQALTHRPPARPLRGGEDFPDADTHPAYLGWDIVDLTHTRDDGRRRPGADPDTARAEREAQQAAQTDLDTRTRPTMGAGPDPLSGSTGTRSAGTGTQGGQPRTGRTTQPPDPNDQPPPF
ncbi:HNH endonuclease [Ornithinimicrobium avium]|uniref:HNH endonuclease n=1 Tax=Ornithinimicrobium avium TaxID=2283195 RepID=A0A345NIE4_9MICO|nr:HNH endonuclease [Ornithinimicrobium avium]